MSTNDIADFPNLSLSIPQGSKTDDFFGSPDLRCSETSVKSTIEAALAYPDGDDRIVGTSGRSNPSSSEARENSGAAATPDSVASLHLTDGPSMPSTAPVTPTQSSIPFVAPHSAHRQSILSCDGRTQPCRSNIEDSHTAFEHGSSTENANHLGDYTDHSSHNISSNTYGGPLLGFDNQQDLSFHQYASNGRQFDEQAISLTTLHLNVDPYTHSQGQGVGLTPASQAITLPSVLSLFSHAQAHTPTGNGLSAVGTGTVSPYDELRPPFPFHSSAALAPTISASHVDMQQLVNSFSFEQQLLQQRLAVEQQKCGSSQLQMRVDHHRQQMTLRYQQQRQLASSDMNNALSRQAGSFSPYDNSTNELGLGCAFLHPCLLEASTAATAYSNGNEALHPRAQHRFTQLEGSVTNTCRGMADMWSDVVEQSAQGHTPHPFAFAPVPLDPQLSKDANQRREDHEGLRNGGDDNNDDFGCEEPIGDFSVRGAQGNDSNTCSNVCAKTPCQFPGCSRVFQSPGLLKSHMVSHQDEKPYWCDMCSYDGITPRTGNLVAGGASQQSAEVKRYKRNHDLLRHKREQHPPIEVKLQREREKVENRMAKRQKTQRERTERMATKRKTKHSSRRNRSFTAIIDVAPTAVVTNGSSPVFQSLALHTQDVPGLVLQHQQQPQHTMPFLEQKQQQFNASILVQPGFGALPM
ncbi:hypothetical protein BGZ99_006107 [Dissophora globulifera]|uniref:C2H2-type domain-containing protein n=1 Tax=Dissophora globulifera TaxID=979702 RepID=A0A9P6RFS9_9FUNG|nr:hypothetical protein BGZ99_006107 [Dissophora globulifera]